MLPAVMAHCQSRTRPKLKAGTCVVSLPVLCGCVAHCVFMSCALCSCVPRHVCGHAGVRDMFWLLVCVTCPPPPFLRLHPPGTRAVLDLLGRRAPCGPGPAWPPRSVWSWTCLAAALRAVHLLGRRAPCGLGPARAARSARAWQGQRLQLQRQLPQLPQFRLLQAGLPPIPPPPGIRRPSTAALTCF